MINERLAELAALHALDLLDEAGQRELMDAARSDPELRDLIRNLTETAALIAYEAPEIPPPPQLKQSILQQLPTRNVDSKIIRFPRWIGYAIAACLMGLGVAQALRIARLEGQLQLLKSTLVAQASQVDQLERSNALKDLRLAVLEKASAAQGDAAYATSHVVVAWDPTRSRGVLSMKDLPAPPPGHDYQLWVLDPKAPAPISAGLLTDSRGFEVNPPSTPNPGFAVSLEPSGGSPVPTGPILFAFAPPSE